MKLCILGGNGMAGHMLVDYFRSKEGWEVTYTSRDRKDPHALYLDAGDEGQVLALLDQLRPDVVMNAVGILNRDAEEHERLAYQVNGLLPHLLRRKLEEWAGKLVHISTDCVFSGEQGDYTEFDLPDGSTVYAISKAMGEVRHPPHLTVRTSIVGPEIRSTRIGLFDWFMSQQGEVKGFTQVYWNGVTTLQLAKSVEQMLGAGTSGLVHLTAPQKVSKYELLGLFQDMFGKTDAVIVPDDHFRQDRTLRCTRTEAALLVPEYRTMLAEMRDWMRAHPSRYI